MTVLQSFTLTRKLIAVKEEYETRTRRLSGESRKGGNCTPTVRLERTTNRRSNGRWGTRAITEGIVDPFRDQRLDAGIGDDEIHYSSKRNAGIPFLISNAWCPEPCTTRIINSRCRLLPLHLCFVPYSLWWTWRQKKACLKAEVVSASISDRHKQLGHTCLHSDLVYLMIWYFYAVNAFRLSPGSIGHCNRRCAWIST